MPLPDRRLARRALRRPEGPHRGRRRRRPRRDPRAVAPDPRRPGDRVRGASRRRGGRGGARPARVRGRVPRRHPGHRHPRRAPRRARRRWSPDRDPRRVRRAPRARARLRPQHDGGVGRRRGDRPGVDGRRAARRDRLPRDPGRGAGERQADHDRRRAHGRSRCRADVPPLRPQPRRELAARLRGRRRRLPRPPGARLVRPVEGPQRARRDDPAVQLGRALAPAARDPRPASTGSSARAGPRRTSSRSGPRPGS